MFQQAFGFQQASGFQQVSDLRDEARELDALLVTLDEATWWRPTPFKGWAPFDVVAHLHRTDCAALLAVTAPDEFIAMRTARTGQINAVTQQREHVQTRDPQVLLSGWRATLASLTDALHAGGAQSGEKGARYPWYGPDMGARSFASARQMEVWAHGQDVYDLLRRPRAPTDRLRNIAEMGVRTYGWTFANRQLAPPGPAPTVRLTAPSGALWGWHEDNDGAGRVEGSALEFCQVVTQGRNVADTQLKVQGNAATEWMRLAQCFAGPPADPPKQGERAW